MAVHARVTQTDEQPGHVRQRHEVPARAERAFAGNFRQHTAIQRREQQINQFLANARVASRQRIGAGQHHGARLHRGEQRALSDQQMMEQMDLMLGQVFCRDAKTAQRAEARVDAVDGARLGGQGFDQLAAAPNQRPRFGHQRAWVLKTSGSPEFLEGEIVPV